ncbi:hypothetical protein NM208_g13910 [Fusarium decemcellulare]|uniref:Uncharacterized protein n=1 Tax=Fusarium decemcellulare TaxID=57161 RepID=A0ACC1RLK4_9HYPO|nr:hypothetical protein NM208_g13910 [Fusarium decemcellulare]
MVMGDFDQSGSSVDVVVEIGPHTALRGPIRQILELPEFTGVQLPYYGSLSRNSDARDTMQTLAANLMKEGWLPHMDPLNFPWGRDSDVKVLSDLPSYTWNHQTRHWVEPRFNRALRERDQEPHDLIGSLVLGTDLGCPSWRHILRLSSSPWLRDHVVQSNVLYPGAGFVCLAIEAAAQIVSMNTMEPVTGPTRDRKVSGYRLRDVDILQALLVPDNSEGTEVQTKIRPADDKEIGLKGWMHFEVKSVTADNHWTLHARGSLCVEYGDTSSTGRTKLDELVPVMPSTATRIAPDDMFASFRSVGIEHGPAFQNLKTIVQSQTDQRSITTLVVADAAGSPDVPRKLVIHPTTLDSIVQAAYTALPKAGYFQESPRVPRKIRNLWISNSISHDTGHMFNACSQVNDADSQSFEADIRLFNAGNDTNGPVLEIQGLLLQSLGQAIDPRNKKPWEREVCNGVEWDIDMGLVSYASLREIERDLRHVGSHERLASDLKPVCLYFIEACLKKLTTAEVSRLSGHFVKFYKWMQDQARLASAGKLSTASNEWLSYSADERARRVKLASMESVVGEMVCHLGPYLADMVRGEKAPLELMVQDRLLYRYYEEAPNLKRCFNQTSRLLRKIVHKNPRARILEIGAGTGSVTRHALEVLGTTQSGGPLAGLYHYTDVSMGFFEAAKSEFSAWNEILAFDKLDIEQDPGTQGFALESYDIVIACEVLHATKSISRTMANVRSLMKPGGSLLLVETTQDQIDIQFVFGLLPGWWLSEESNRQTSPSLDVPSWDQALKNAGFTGVEVAINDCEDASTYAFSTILSRVPPATTHTELMSEEIVLVVDSEAIPPQDWVTSLARSLDSVGSSPEVHVFDSPAVTEATCRGKVCVFLGEVHRNVLFEMSSTTLERLKILVANCAGLVWITVGGAVNCENPCSALATGFVRSLRNEYVGRRFMTLDLDPTASAWSSTSCQAISQVLKHAFSENDIGILDTPLVEFEYAERAGAVLTPRYLKDATRNEIVSPDRQYQSSPGEIATELFHQQGRPLRLQVGTRGLLDTLVFDDDRQAITSDTPLPGSLVEIQVYAYGLNFRDVMVAMGQLEDKVMGIECAGIITRVGQLAASHGHVVGDRVFCLLRGPFGSRVHTEWWNVVPMPDGLSFEEAASMPMIFTTAYVALVDVAHLQRGQSILVHAAAGGVGQAAIQLAQWLGANIYATVGTPEKRKLIRHKYGIPDHQIFNSRDTSFGTSVLNATGGRGVDMVLNSLAGPLLQEGFNVVAPFGHFVEIGKRDLEQNNLLEMRPFARHVSFSALDILNMTSGRGDDIRRVLTEIARLTTRRVITPIDPITSFPISDITKAFRLMQTGKHTGKVVVSTGTQDMVSVQHHRKTVQLSPNASYLLVGGLGGIGRCIASWLVQVGAKSIILLSRSAGASEKDRMFVQDLSRTGCKIKPLSCDVSKGDDLQRALQICKDDGLPAIRGVIQAAMVLQVSVLRWNWHACNEASHPLTTLRILFWSR